MVCVIAFFYLIIYFVIELCKAARNQYEHIKAPMWYYSNVTVYCTVSEKLSDIVDDVPHQRDMPFLM